MTARPATPDDARELVRLRTVMFAALGPVPTGGWESRCEDVFRHRLAQDDAFAVYVTDTHTGQLAACAIGTYTPRLPSPRSTAAHVGAIHAVAADPAHRRQGHATACLTALLDWLDTHDCSRTELRASHDGQALYTRLGFTRMNDTFMTRPARPATTDQLAGEPR